MKAGLLSLWAAFMLSCVLSYSFTAKARFTGFNPDTINSTQQSSLQHKNKEGSFFEDAYMRRISTVKKEPSSTAATQNKVTDTQLKVSVQRSLGHNHAGTIKVVETLASNDRGTQIFSRRRNKSMTKIAPANKKDIAVMAFRPSSSGHSPGIGHGNPPNRRL